MRSILTSARLVTFQGDAEDGYGLREGASLGIDGERIAWVGQEIPRDWEDAPPTDLEGRLVTPALVDCHTHLVYGGDRSDEFERRHEGVSYAQIAREGGGILSTVRATRSLSVDELVQAALPRLDRLLRDGVGTVEIKSGYGLTIDSELRMLRVARRLGTERPVRVTTTWLAAHAVPPEYRGRPDDYLTEVALPGLEQAVDEGLVDAVDVFSESIAFDLEQTQRVFEHAQGLGLPVKVHAEQLTRSGAARLAARYGARSADHLEYLDDDGVRAMAEAGVVAVLLPGAYHTLRETQPPPVQALRDAGVPMAVATDHNPGTSPLESVLLAANLACAHFGLTPREALTGLTRHGAHALGRVGEIGVIQRGAMADLAVWSARTPAELVARMGALPLVRRMHGGAWVADPT